MKRIVFLVLRLFYRIPWWLLRIRYYNRHLEETSFEERFTFVEKLIDKVSEKARIHIHCFGVENLPNKNGYLLTPNHQGLFDALILFDTHQRPFKAVVKEELMHVFVLKDVLRMLQFVPIDRSNLRASVKLIKDVSQEMSEGMNYVIFPEGTRCRKKNEMLEFKGGTFKAAMNAHKPIVPVALIDCYKVFDNDSLERVNTQIHYLKPLYYQDYKDMNTTQVAQYVQSKIKECIEENENRF